MTSGGIDECNRNTSLVQSGRSVQALHSPSAGVVVASRAARGEALRRQLEKLVQLR